MRRIGLWVMGAVALVALASSAQAQVAWAVVQPSDCTGVAAPVPCCVASGATANHDQCNVRMNFGSTFEVNATIRTVAGGTYTAGAVETSSVSGDRLAIAEFRKLGLSTVLYIQCQVGNTGRVFQLVRQRATASSPLGTQLAVKAFNLTNAGGTGTAPSELAPSTAIAAGENLTCLIYGR